VIYLYSYLAVGFLALVIIFTTHQIHEHRKHSSTLKGLFHSSHRHHKEWKERLLESIAIPLTAFFIVVIWPYAVYMNLVRLYMYFNPSSSTSDDNFSVEVGHLIEELSIQEIEKRERVYDPLGSVPDLAFGHLNKTWNQFLHKAEAYDAIWSFEAKWKHRLDQSGRIEHKIGYVLVNQKKHKPGAFFLTYSQEIWPSD